MGEDMMMQAPCQATQLQSIRQTYRFWSLLDLCRYTAWRQIVLEYEVAYVSMSYHAAISNDLLSRIMVFPILSYLTMHPERLSFLYTFNSGYYLLEWYHTRVTNKLKKSLCNIIIHKLLHNIVCITFIKTTNISVTVSICMP
jgi:hypothetical protein